MRVLNKIVGWTWGGEENMGELYVKLVVGLRKVQIGEVTLY